MSGLDRFYKSRTGGDRVIGTYLWPLRLFGDPDPEDRYSATEVIRNIPIGSHDVLVTRNSGLFVRPPDTFSDPYREGEAEYGSDLKAKMSFEEEVASSFNRLICELALMGIVSEPASPVHISYGQLIDGHALVTVASGGREIYEERSLFPSLALLRGTGEWLLWPMHPETVLDEAANQACTMRLVDISSSLPAFVAGAYYAFSRYQPSEALMSGWIVTEQILDHLWEEYISTIPGRPRRDRLEDKRTYTAAVRAEVLLTAGEIQGQMYELIQTARKHRNDLAHRAKISLSNARDSLTAMKAVIEFVCQREVAPPAVATGVNW